MMSQQQMLLKKQFDLSLEPKDNEPRIPAAVGAGPGGV